VRDSPGGVERSCARQGVFGSLDRVTRVVRLGISLATTPEFREHPKVADSASELLVNVFGADKTSTRLVFGMASLPVGVCVVIESIFELITERFISL